MIFTKDEKELRDVYAQLLIEYGKQDERICIVESDLMRSGGTMPFSKEFPHRTFDAGIAEADMMCIASGLSYMGKIPFTHTFCVFASRRDAHSYVHGHEEIMEKYGSHIVMEERMPLALADAMGNQMYTANFETAAEADAFAAFVQLQKGA